MTTDDPNAIEPAAPLDRNGLPVHVGSRVRVLKIAAFLERTLPEEEWQQLRTMVGQVFQVESIDEHGQPWVEKVWKLPEGGSRSHGLALAPDEMELVQS